MIWALVIGVLVIGGIGTAALLLGWPLGIPIGVSLLVLAAIGVLLAFRFLRSRRRAAELEAELRRQSKDSAARPEAVLEIQGRVRELAETLRRDSGGKRFGNRAVYALPWYLVLGPPGAGKSTALQNTGLALRAGGGRQPKTRTAAPTKGIETWLADGGVLIDTAGRYALGDGEEAEWAGLLATLRRTRRQKPLDGIVLAYSVSELVSDRPEQLEEKAKRLRACLEDLGSKLGSVLPVYLVLTKTDLLPGFSDFYADVGAEGSDFIWGATFEPRRNEGLAPREALKAEFDLLKEALHARLLARLPAAQRTPDSCAKALRFPVEFETVRAPLARLVEELFRPSSYQEAALLRGFYFTSSGGLETAGHAFQGPGTQFAVHTHFAAPSVAHSYFLGELFPRVVFPDRNFATRSRRRLLSDRRQQALLVAAALTVFLFGVVPPALSCISNWALIDSTLDDVRAATRMGTGRAQAGLSSDALDLLSDRFAKLQADVNRFSVRRWWGPYTAEPLRDALRVRYLDQLRAVLHGPVRDRLSDSIRISTDQRGLDPASFETAYKDLELYLMLAHPERLNADFAGPKLRDVWARGAAPGSASPSVSAHVQSYLERLGQDPSWAWPEDATLVMRARTQLSLMPIEELKYSALERAAADAPPVLPEHIFTGGSARYVSTHGKVEVAGLYTALGWQRVQPLLRADRNVEFAPWVLAGDSSEAPPWGVEQIRKIYFDRYIRAWMDFLVGLDVAIPPNLNAAIEELSALGKGEGPYVRLFRRLAENVRLELEQPSIKDQALQKAQQLATQVASQVVPGVPVPAPPPERLVSPVELHFRRMVRFGFGDGTPTPGAELPPSPLNQYLEQLRTLEVSLRQLQDSAVEPSTAFGSELASTSASIERLLAGFDQTERLALEPLLLNPIRGSQQIVEAKGRAALTDRWRVEVWEPYRHLVTRYPFVPSSGSDVSLPDFAEFFRPQSGTLWRFYNEMLANDFVRSGDRFVPRPLAVKAGFRPDLLECLSVAQQIDDAVFIDGAQQPSVPFKIKMQAGDARVSETIFKVDGETLVYRNEPEKWRALQWPGKDGPAGASLQVKGADFDALVRREDGEFGFYRLLAAGNIKPLSPGSLILEASWSWMLKGAESRVTIQFQASRQRYPFLPGFFSRLICPSAMTQTTEKPSRRNAR